MKIIVLNFQDFTVDLVSRSKVCLQYGEKTTVNGELVPRYEYLEKKRQIVSVAEEAPGVVEDDMGPKKAKQWFLEATLRHLEELNGPVWVFFDRSSAMSEIISEIETVLEHPAEGVDQLEQVKGLNGMLKVVVKMEDPN